MDHTNRKEVFKQDGGGDKLVQRFVAQTKNASTSKSTKRKVVETETESNKRQHQQQPSAESQAMETTKQSSVLSSSLPHSPTSKFEGLPTLHADSKSFLYATHNRTGSDVVLPPLSSLSLSLPFSSSSTSTTTTATTLLQPLTPLTLPLSSLFSASQGLPPSSLPSPFTTPFVDPNSATADYITPHSYQQLHQHFHQQLHHQQQQQQFQQQQMQQQTYRNWSGQSSGMPPPSPHFTHITLPSALQPHSLSPAPFVSHEPTRYLAQQSHFYPPSATVSPSVHSFQTTVLPPQHSHNAQQEQGLEHVMHNYTVATAKSMLEAQARKQATSLPKTQRRQTMNITVPTPTSSRSETPTTMTTTTTLASIHFSNNNTSRLRTPLDDRSNNRFVLQEDLQEVQRKSYSQENRCLKPSPVIVQDKRTGDESTPKVVTGRVSVKLVAEDGADLPFASEALHSIEGKHLTATLNSQGKANFYLKVTETSGGTHNRLQFTIQYLVEGGIKEQEETIFSAPFIVYSNKGNAAKKKSHKNVFSITNNDNNNDKSYNKANTDNSITLETTIASVNKKDNDNHNGNETTACGFTGSTTNSDHSNAHTTASSVTISAANEFNTVANTDLNTPPS